MRLMFTALLWSLLIHPCLMADESQAIQLVVQPRLLELPVLKYQLFPAEFELKNGNAAPILLRLPWEQTAWMNANFPKLNEWNEVPLTATEWKNWNDALPQKFYDEMKRAAYRRYANWEYPIDETPDPYAILLPDVQGLRTFLGAGLSAKIRYHITRGESDLAREGILVGIANGKHVAQTPFFINQLVACAIQQTMLSRTTELISQPESPNLYWALSTLPDSLVEFQRASSFESTLFAKTLPAVNQLDHPRDAKEWQRMAVQLVQLLESSMEIPPLKKIDPNASIFQQLLNRMNPEGKSRLAAFVTHARAESSQLLAIPPERIRNMSDEEVSVRWYVATRVANDQAMAAAMALKPKEAWPRLIEVQASLKSMQQKTGSRRLEFLNPASIYLTVWSLKRKVETLRVIEALRHYLAGHAGNWPNQLDLIRDLSIPLDPLTDLPFEFRIDGDVAILKTPPVPPGLTEPMSDFHKRLTLEYHLRLKPTTPTK